MIKIIVKSIQLILPVMVPSWRFFDTIAPSPRVEFALCDGAGAVELKWQEFWPRPDYVGPLRMLRRLVWNPCWNESLYVTACAERLIKLQDKDTQTHSANQIARRIREALPEAHKADSFKFQLVFVARDGTKVERHILYISQIYAGEPQ